MTNKINLVISADHGGYELKEELKIYLTENHSNINVIDVGAHKYDALDDFPDMTSVLSKTIFDGEADKGIAICGSGVGASMVANKNKGIRAAVCHDDYSASQGVEHNNMNVLCLGGRVVDIEEAKSIVDSFLTANFLNEEKYVRRLNKINKLD
jgi:RpiB/LacA/LacB family sugar-phosphate isomerase